MTASRTSSLRIVVFALLGWSGKLLWPFLGMMVWGGVLATALHPVYARFADLLGNRRTLAAILFALIPVALLSLPTGLLLKRLAEDLVRVRAAYAEGSLHLPPAPEWLATVPIMGESLASGWKVAEQNLVGFLKAHAPEATLYLDDALRAASRVVVSIVKLLFSLVMMAAFLARAKATGETVRALIRRIATENGDSLVVLARDTTRSVARGIVGVAFIQGLLGGLGCLVAGVPGAGVWALLILVLAVAQITPMLVLLPAAIYVFNHEPSWIGVAFSVWSIVVGLIDNVLKPILLGKGVDAPMLVVFLGAIGGLLSSGVIGLFVGPVVLAVTYTLIRAWALQEPNASP